MEGTKICCETCVFGDKGAGEVPCDGCQDQYRWHSKFDSKSHEKRMLIEELGAWGLMNALYDYEEYVLNNIDGEWTPQSFEDFFEQDFERWRERHG